MTCRGEQREGGRVPRSKGPPHSWGAFILIELLVVRLFRERWRRLPPLPECRDKESKNSESPLLSPFAKKASCMQWGIGRRVRKGVPYTPTNHENTLDPRTMSTTLQLTPRLHPLSA